MSYKQARGCTTSATGMGFRVHDRVHGVAGTASQASGLRFMSAQRMTLELRKAPDGAGFRRIGRQLRLAAGLIVLALPLSGCGTGSLSGKFMAKDHTFLEEPARKVSNYGLDLLTQ